MKNLFRLVNIALVCCASGALATDTQWQVLRSAQQRCQELGEYREVSLGQCRDGYKVLTPEHFSVQIFQSGEYLTVSVGDLINAKLGDILAQDKISALLDYKHSQEECKLLSKMLRDVWYWANDLKNVQPSEGTDVYHENFPDEYKWVYRPIRSIDFEHKRTSNCLALLQRQYDVLFSKEGYGTRWVNEVCELLEWSAEQDRIESYLISAAITDGTSMWVLDPEVFAIFKEVDQNYLQDAHLKSRMLAASRKLKCKLERSFSSSGERRVEFAGKDPEAGFIIHNYKDPFGRSWDIIALTEEHWAKFNKPDSLELPDNPTEE